MVPVGAGARAELAMRTWPPATEEQFLEKIRRQFVCRLGPADHDQIVVPGVKHDASERISVFLLPARRHPLPLIRHVTDLDLRPRAELAKVLRRDGRAGLGLGVELAQGIGQRWPHCESRMRRIGCRLAGADMNVKKIQMARKRPRRSECSREQCLVSDAAADRNKE